MTKQYFPLSTEDYAANSKTTCDEAADAICQTKQVREGVAKITQDEQNRLVKAWGLNEGLSLDKINPCGRGSKWAKAVALLMKALEKREYAKAASCQRAANRALNAAGFKSRNRVVKVDWAERMVLSMMEYFAKRDKDGNVTELPEMDDLLQACNSKEMKKAVKEYFTKLQEAKIPQTLPKAA